MQRTRRPHGSWDSLEPCVARPTREPRGRPRIRARRRLCNRLQRTLDGGTSYQTVASGGGGSWKSVTAIDALTYVYIEENRRIQKLHAAAGIPDHDPGTNDWTAGDSSFGACLRSVTDGATTDAGTWAVDGTCDATDASTWYGIGTLATGPDSTIARTIVPGTTSARAHLRFGARIGPATPPGTYRADLTFEVVAPAT